MPNAKDETKKPRGWYRFALMAAVAGAAPTEADLWIYDQIGLDFWTGEGVTAKQFIDELGALPESVSLIRLHMNCPGGSVFDAVAIANALRGHRASVEVSIEALAASAATIITMAGDRIVIAENALVMIHQPVTFTYGTAAEIRRDADMLDSLTDAVLATYAWHSTKSRDELVAMMEATTWMDAAEAVEAGFATEIGEAAKAAAHVDAKLLAKLGPAPERYRDRVAALLEEPKPEAEPAPAPDATAPAAARAGAEVIDLAAEREKVRTGERAAHVARVKAIREIAATLKLVAYGNELAADVDCSVESAREKLFAKLAADGPEITSHVDANARPAPGARAVASPSEIYARRRGEVEQAITQRR